MFWKWVAPIGIVVGSLSIIGVSQSQILRFSGAGTFPAGVTLSAISGGAAYYGSNGFTKATSPIIFGGVSYPQGWDSPGFLPIGISLSFLANQTEANQWINMGLNTAYLIANPYSGQMNLAHNNSISVISGVQYLGAIIFLDQQPGAETVGYLTYDEPPSTAELLTAPITGTTTASFSGTMDSSCFGSNTCLTVTGFPGGLGPIPYQFNTGYNVPSLAYIQGAGIPAFSQIFPVVGTGRGGNGTYALCNTNPPEQSPSFAGCGFTGYTALGPETMTVAAVSGLTPTLLSGRFLNASLAGLTNFNSLSLAYANSSGNTATTPLTTALALTAPIVDGSAIRHIDTMLADIFYITYSRTGNNGALSNVYDTSNGSPPLTQAQGAKGSHYGDMIDFQRSYQTTFTIPVWQFIETGNANLGIPYDAQPVELNWSVWSTLIHGGLGIVYFDTSDTFSADQCAFTATNNIYCAYMQASQGANCTSCTYYPLQAVLTVSSIAGVGRLFPGMQTSAAQSTILQQVTGVPAQPGLQGNYAVSASPTGNPLWFAQPSSMTSAMASTNQLVSSMAPILKANYALGYVTVSPSGYKYDPVMANTGIGQNISSAISTGFEVMAKYYQGAQYTASDGTTITPNTFYIFADSRFAETMTPQTATFTLAGHASNIKVINESRSITPSGGGFSFSDTFNNAWTVHIYQVVP